VPSGYMRGIVGLNSPASVRSASSSEAFAIGSAVSLSSDCRKSSHRPLRFDTKTTALLSAVHAAGKSRLSFNVIDDPSIRDPGPIRDIRQIEIGCEGNGNPAIQVPAFKVPFELFSDWLVPFDVSQTLTIGRPFGAADSAVLVNIVDLPRFRSIRPHQPEFAIIQPAQVSAESNPGAIPRNGPCQGIIAKHVRRPARHRHGPNAGTRAVRFRIGNEYCSVAGPRGSELPVRLNALECLRLRNGLGLACFKSFNMDSLQVSESQID
jgi:hypothetical protein